MKIRNSMAHQGQKPTFPLLSLTSYFKSLHEKISLSHNSSKKRFFCLHHISEASHYINSSIYPHHIIIHHMIVRSLKQKSKECKIIRLFLIKLNLLGICLVFYVSNFISFYQHGNFPVENENSTGGKSFRFNREYFVIHPAKENNFIKMTFIIILPRITF